MKSGYKIRGCGLIKANKEGCLATSQQRRVLRRDVNEIIDTVLGIPVGCSTQCEGQGGRKCESFFLNMNIECTPGTGTDLLGQNEF